MALLIRGLGLYDTSRVVELYDEIHAGDPSVSSITAAAWERFMHLPVNADGVGFRLVEEDGTPVGLLSSSLRQTELETVRPFRIIVTPSRHRQGIGTRLLAALVALDDSRDVILQSLCPQEWVSGRSFLEHRGFLLVESELTMRCTTSPAFPLAIGTTIELAASPLHHAAEVARMHNAAYLNDVSFVPHTEETMGQTLAQGSELWLLIRENELLGYCQTERSGAFTWIDSLVIDPRFQSEGLGTRLCAAVVCEALQTPGNAVELQVSDRNHAAMAVYRRLGFKQINTAYRMRADRIEVAKRLDLHG